ncbi:hypothetical protein [Peribacillus butanolivorans]|uniref:hypothetical protein n=1 Tax=Peribacillus butanolivorans TaxID=421767 RepID=UPI00366BBFD0
MERKHIENFELYDHNEKSGGRVAGIKYTDLYENDNDKQEHLVYEYLHDKGLIDYKILGRNTYQAKITPRGIDRIIISGRSFGSIHYWI